MCDCETTGCTQECEITQSIKTLQPLFGAWLELREAQASVGGSLAKRSSGSVMAGISRDDLEMGNISEGATDISEDSNSTAEQANKKLAEISQTVTKLIILETEGNVDRERIRRISHQMALLSKSLEELASSQAKISDDNHKLISDKIYTTLSELFKY